MSDTHIHIHLNGESVAATTSPKKAKRRATSSSSKKAVSPPKKKGKPNPKLKRAMKKAHSVAKKKDGSFKKGWNASKMMKHAHKLAKK